MLIYPLCTKGFTVHFLGKFTVQVIVYLLIILGLIIKENDCLSSNGKYPFIPSSSHLPKVWIFGMVHPFCSSL